MELASPFGTTSEHPNEFKLLIRRTGDYISHLATDVSDGSWLCENSNACRAHRILLWKLRTMKTDNTADSWLDATLKKFIFFIFPMYEFLHSLGQLLHFCDVRVRSAYPPRADKILQRRE